MKLPLFGLGIFFSDQSINFKNFTILKLITNNK
jgi:hypothetical protein